MLIIRAKRLFCQETLEGRAVFKNKTKTAVIELRQPRPVAWGASAFYSVVATFF